MAEPQSTRPLIEHIRDLPAYSPPAHRGTVNRRLVTREFGAGFEMILGRVEPGGEASPHYHRDESQVVYVLSGEALVTLGGGEPRRCGPGTVIRIPPRLVHEVRAVSEEPLEVIVLYAPPVGAEGFFEVSR